MSPSRRDQGPISAASAATDPQVEAKPGRYPARKGPPEVEGSSHEDSHDAEVVGGSGDHTATVAVKVTVTVPAVAWIELDAEGRLVAAATNTRCAPRDGDKLAVRGPDRRLLTDVTIDLAAIHWVGDFTEPGVLVPQADHVLITG